MGPDCPVWYVFYIRKINSSWTDLLYDIVNRKIKRVLITSVEPETSKDHIKDAS
jgi:hypothetical protein